ncbi:MAG TPA: DEAD/DEAH box helicase [Egicoccus sp.]|nr:DEAD/DEAH box helicase [Egicoccus sp.]HSK23454.1 DEAD/DEAH box helicase [Egicoccus sp.]
MTKTFRDLGVDPALCEALEAQGIIHPFPIQELTLPLALGRNDLIAQARTGTGKTLGFGLPLLQQIDPDLAATQALVIVPTRELCQQVHDDLSIGETRGLTTISVYGGVGFDEQIAALQSGVHVVVGTPGRLLDHLKRGNLDLSQVKVLVLDEADEMLDMGFLPDVERLIEATPSEGRHTMLFSATMPTVIVKMARRYLHHPTFMRADTEEHETAPNVAQHFFSVHRMDKPRVLARILQSPNRGGCYVFVRTKHMADRLVNDLEDLGVPAIAIHGDLRQQTREKNLDRFRSGKADVLVATEVAARGIDVTGVTHVVNYDCPDDQKMYLHRIGRTARAGNEGVAITFAEFNEADRLNVIRKAVGATDTEVHQIFSTSPLLAELFDLPDERPWDHLSKSSSRSGGGRDGGREHDRDDVNRRSAPRKGRSDGRPKSRRDSEGSGRDRDAARRKGRGDDGGRTPHEAKDTKPEPARTPSDDDTTARPAPQRERTRTRSRSADRPTDTDRPRNRDAAPAESTPAPGDRDDSRGTSSSGRTRARSAGRDRKPAEDDRGETTRGEGSSRTRASRPSGGSRETRKDDGAKADGASNDGAKADRGGSRQGSERNRDDDGGRASGGGRSGSGSRNKSSSRGGASRSGSSSRGGNQRQSRDPEPTPGVRPAPRGAEARGDGDPQLARRVRVEHLP